MKKTIAIALTACFLAMALSASSLRVEKKEEIRKTLKFQEPSKPKEIQVDNVFGSIEVEGYKGQEVKLLVHKTIRARTEERIKKAQEEVRLDISEEGNTIDLYVDGPFRCHHRKTGHRGWRDPGYIVIYDFELKVPHQTSLYLRTVNKGDIKVEKVEGEFEVKNVNGRIEMIEVGGSGAAHTVNGKVNVVFSQNPESDCSFHTINGDLEITFCQNLSADFWLKTFNGDAYSDFSVTYLPAELPHQKHYEGKYKGKYVYKSNRFFGVRVGKGGPEIKLDTLNGDILIAERKK